VWLTGVAMAGFAAAPALRPGPMPDADLIVSSASES